MLIDALKAATAADLEAIDAEVERLKLEINRLMNFREFVAEQVGVGEACETEPREQSHAAEHSAGTANGVHVRSDLDLEAVRRDATTALADGPLGVRDLAKRAGYRSMEITAAMAGDERFAKVYGKWQLADRGVTA